MCFLNLLKMYTLILEFMILSPLFYATFSADATKDFKFCFAYKHKKNPSTLEIIGLSSFQHALPISPKAAKKILFHENV